MRKEDYEKAAWGWTDETDPEYVSQHHVDLAYRIKLDSCRPNSCRKNCRGNPLCVKGLGESRWIGPKAAAAAEEAWSSSLEDPNALRRAEDSFVGLKNLGATCYINSLLQLWFHNLEFRWAIYLWSPEEDPQEKMNETIMAGEYKPESSTAHLQVLFALMQFGKRSYEDPSDFIRSLDVDTTQQQDAQEFSKLFFSLLEKGLSHQSSHAVKNIISQQFCGTLSYITKCAHCFTDSDTPALFYELELNIAGHTTLSECMEEYFKEEELQGDNRYLCSVCKAKQDATRQTVLKSLPPVLNLQLIRFVYDRQKGVKKKLHSYLQFPESLDMSPYVKKPLGSLMYSISAVLIHTGPSAYSGHYVAHICESTTGTWYKFNDEAVEKMEGKKLKLGTEDSFEDGNKKNKPPKATKGNLVSNNAYMLVYTESKKKEQQSAENNVIQATDKEYFSLSQRLKDFVAREGQKFEDWVSEVKKSKAVLVEKSKAKQQEMEKICNMLPVIGNAPYEFISADWLAKWLTTDDVKSIDNSSFICKDGKLDPSKVDKTKCISTCAADVLYSKYGGGPRLLGENSKCFDCVKHSCKVIRMKAKIAEDSKKVASLLKFKPASGETLFWVGKDSLKNWRKLVLQEIEDVHKKDTVKESNGCNGEAGSSVDEVTTSRNNQDDRLVGSSESNVVSSTSNTTSQNNQDDRLVDSSESNDVSSTSENHIHASENGLEQKLKYVQIKTPGFGGDVIHRESVDSEMCEVSEGDTVPANNAAGISSSDDPVYHEEQAVHNGKVPECPVKEEGTKEEEQDDEEALDFNEDLRCTHGDLCVEQSFRRLVSEQVWEIFKSYFPSAPTFVESTEACRHCEDRTHEDAVTSGIYRQAAASQKAKLLDLYLVRNRVSFSVSPSLQRQKQPMNQVFHLVSRKFINSWRKFIRCPGQRVPPDTIENSDLLCPHGGLLYNPEIEEDSNSSCSFEIASDAEWEALCSFYPSDRDIVVKRDPCNNTLIYNPDICPECVMERIRLEQMERLQYDKAKIFVRKVNKRDTSNERINECANGAATTSQTENKDDPEYQGGEVKRPKLAPGVSNSPTHRGGSPAGEGRVRKSTRHRRVRGEVEFSVSSNTTLMDFKVKVMHEFEVAPFDQHLSLNGRELLDTNATLGSLQVFPGSIIVLKADEPSEDPSMMEDYISGLTFEEGFKGTALLK